MITRNRVRWISSLALSLACVASAEATTRRVPEAYSTVQAALDAASPGDTVLVGPGLYAENLRITKRLHLLANGAPGTVVIRDPTPGGANPGGSVPPGAYVIYVDAPGTAGGPGEIAGFVVWGLFDTNGAGVHVNTPGWTVRDCRVFDNWFGISAQAPTTVSDNTVATDNLMQRSAVAVGVTSGGGSLILRNVVVVEGTGAYVTSGDVVAGNLFANQFNAVRVQYDASGPVTIANNVFTTVGTTNSGSQMNHIVLGTGPAVVTNNVLAYGGRGGVASSASTTGALSVRHNDVYLNRPNYADEVGDRTGIDGNVSVGPHFAFEPAAAGAEASTAAEDPAAFYLRSDSPLIDAGDPAVLDADGSRSDIGLHGGPYGGAVRYAPASFVPGLPADSASVGATVPLNWAASFDRDPGASVTYRVLVGRALAECSIHPFQFARVACLSGPVDTLDVGAATEFTYALAPADSASYFWTVEAVDETGLYTPSGIIREFHFSAMVAVETPPSSPALSLGPPSPNPTSGRTVIPFTLAEASHVRMDICDALGRRVAAVLDGPLPAGEHTATWSADRLARGMYVVRLTAGASSHSVQLVVR